MRYEKPPVPKPDPWRLKQRQRRLASSFVLVKREFEEYCNWRLFCSAFNRSQNVVHTCAAPLLPSDSSSQSQFRVSGLVSRKEF